MSEVDEIALIPSEGDISHEIARLSPRQLQAIALMTSTNLTMEEIADELGVNSSTLRRWKNIEGHPEFKRIHEYVANKTMEIALLAYAARLPELANTQIELALSSETNDHTQNNAINSAIQNFEKLLTALVFNQRIEALEQADSV